MKENPLKQLKTYGQSVWLDYIRCDLIAGGELQHMIEGDGIRGMTSNPSIFQKAIAESSLYDNDIHDISHQNKDFKYIYEFLSQRDVRNAADVFRDLYENSDGADGYVSLEVNPHLAYDTKGTIEEARRLWKALDRPNVLIKVPATFEGLPAIRQLISEGISINVTLLFGLPRYRQVAEAYIAGLEDRINKGDSVHHIASVASFFLSRIDTLVDSRVENYLLTGGKHTEAVKNIIGQVAIASAKEAYQIYLRIFESTRFKKLTEKGAHAQRLLWASTSSKNPDYSDIKYIEPLIGQNTVTTVPLETISAYRDHGKPESRIGLDIKQALMVLDLLPKIGINIDNVSQQLEDEGAKKFVEPFDMLLKSITGKTSSAH